MLSGSQKRAKASAKKVKAEKKKASLDKYFLLTELPHEMHKKP